MNLFSLKKIKDEEENFSKLLTALRLEKKIELEFIAKKIGIKKEYLKAIEDNRLDLIPSGIYKKSYLKKYAEFIGINKETVDKKIKDIEEEEKDDPFSKKVVNRSKLLVFPRIIKVVIFSFAVLLCIFYLLFYLRKTITPPKLIITSPENNLLTEERSVTIAGETENEVELKINGELVLNNNNGNFSQTINLKSGINNITITAKKKYSRENVIIKQILVE